MKHIIKSLFLLKPTFISFSHKSTKNKFLLIINDPKMWQLFFFNAKESLTLAWCLCTALFF